MAHALGLRVVVEGVETGHQHGFVRGAGCEEGQGFYYAKPLAPDAFALWLLTRVSSLAGLQRAVTGAETARSLEYTS
jgi:sensor c-di-GMP phosphodiesterase-like protein